MMNRTTVWVGVTVGVIMATGLAFWVRGGSAAQPAAETQLAIEAPASQPPTPEIEQASEPPVPVRVDRAPEPPASEPAKKPTASKGKDSPKSPSRDKSEFIKKFDTDGDGKLSKEEAIAAKRAVSSQKQSDPRLQALMRVLNDRYDADGDGVLSEDERQVLNQEFGEAKRQIVSDIMPRYDLDGDGRLTGEEKEAAGPEFERAYDRLGAFALLDDDGSWDIDPVELALAIAAMSEGDDLMDLNGDGNVDHEDAVLAADIAASGG